MALINRFADPAIERAYAVQARAALAPVVRRLAYVAMIAVAAYFVLNPIWFASAAVARFNTVAVAQLLSALAYALVARTGFYTRAPGLDFGFYAVFAVLSAAQSTVQGEQGAVTGWPFAAVLALNTYVLFAFSSVCFVASFRWYLAWVALETAWFVGLVAAYGAPPLTQSYTTAGVLAIATIVLYANWSADARARALFDVNRSLAGERHEMETLLNNMLPPRVAERLRRGETVADAYFDVTVVYIDIVDFSALAEALAPGHLVELLDRLFSAIDAAAADGGVEKIKTLGDAYLAVAGPGRAAEGDNNALAAVAFARDVLVRAAALAAEAGLPLQLRVGIHTGPIVGGVIGRTRIAYDYWGETMNFASRLQEAALPGGICLSEVSWRRTRDVLVFAAERRVAFKGVGEVAVHDLTR